MPHDGGSSPSIQVDRSVSHLIKSSQRPSSAEWKLFRRVCSEGKLHEACTRIFEYFCNALITHEFPNQTIPTSGRWSGVAAMGLPKIAFDEPDFATVLNAPLQYGDDGAVLGPDFIVISDGVTRAQDSAFFSHQLVQLISAGLPRLPRRDLGKEIYHLVEYAQDLMISVKLPGSATLSIVVRNGNELYIATLGDSEVKVLRGSSVIYRSPMQRSGSTPGQLNARRPGGVEEMHIERIRIQPGDTTIAATDGLWDNLLEKEVVTLVKHSRHSDAVSLAGTLMRQAQVMKEGNRKHCSDGGNRRCVGARRDDITIIVAKV